MTEPRPLTLRLESDGITARLVDTESGRPIRISGFRFHRAPGTAFSVLSVDLVGVDMAVVGNTVHGAPKPDDSGAPA